jgi:hypothetical protein
MLPAAMPSTAMSAAPLRDRGVGHLHHSIVADDLELKSVGCFQGRPAVAYPRHIPVPKMTANLQYRGIQYCVNAEGGVEAIAPDAVSPVSTLATPEVITMRPTINARKVLMRQLSNVHRQNIQRSLQHRINTAKEHGDEQLVRHLELEMQQFS